jgi:hypothetical protein
MKKYDLGATDLSQYDQLTEAEREAWLHPEPYSYHSFHVERMGADTFRWRNSIESKFYIGTANELLSAVYEIKLRRVDPQFQESGQQTQLLKILSDAEVADLLSDL